MRKLIWQNSLGDEINLTKAPFGIINWEGFSNAPLNIQSQQVPMQDGSIFLDALIENRDLSVTLSIQDGNDLEKRYELERQLIHILNPKLGEGYLIYTNDFISKRIKCIPQIPLFPNKNSNDPGTQKGELAWTACEPYWEDLNETSVFLNYGMKNKITNNGDVATNIKVDFFTTNVTNPQIENITENKKIKLNGNVQKNVYINTNVGQKQIFSKEFVFTPTVLQTQRNNVIYSENLGLFVAVGPCGLLTSSDGINWTSKIFYNLDSVVYSKNKNLFVAVGNSTNFATSPDGINWTRVNSYLSGSYSSIAYSENLGLFVAVGANNNVATSSNGINWTRRTSGVTNMSFGDVIYSENLGLFVAVGGNSNIIKILTSPDGINWTDRTSSIEISGSLSSVTYSGNLGLFVAVGYVNGSEGSIILTSSNGINWNNITNNINTPLFSVTYSKKLDLFVAVGFHKIKIISHDGINWVVIDLETVYNYLFSITYSETLGIFVAVGQYGTMQFSYDGVNWTNICKGNSDYLKPICYSKKLDLFVAVGYNSKISSDCVNWEEGNVVGASNSIIYSENLGLFVAVGNIGKISTSVDGINWTSRTSGTNRDLNLVIYSINKNLFVAVGFDGVILTSSDGINWTSRTSGTNEFLNSVTYSENLGLFVVVGYDGIILTSSDGINWSSGAFLSESLYSITYSENLGLFVAVGSPRCIYISENGIYWQRITLDSSTYKLSLITYSETLGLFIAFGDGPNNVSLVYISSDGTNWINLTGILYNITISSAIYSEKLNSFICLGNGVNNGGDIILKSYFILSENLISKLSSDSDMTLNLKTGMNELLLSETSGDLTARITYRQKYIGV